MATTVDDDHGLPTEPNLRFLYVAMAAIIVQHLENDGKTFLAVKNEKRAKLRKEGRQHWLKRDLSYYSWPA